MEEKSVRKRECDMNVGDTVVINKCDECPAIVGKTAKIIGESDGGFLLNFGRGRPQMNRPKVIAVENVSIDITNSVGDESDENNRS
jgi:hypothetical protein